MGERLLCKQDVASSILVTSTNYYLIMRIVPIECPIVINKFSQHNILKDEVLREINAQQFIPINDPSASINRADWDVPREVWKR